MEHATANGHKIPDEAPKVNLQLHKKHDVCLVLDFGSQYTQLIARRVREQDVYSMLLPGDVSLVGTLAFSCFLHPPLLDVLCHSCNQKSLVTFSALSQDTKIVRDKPVISGTYLGIEAAGKAST